MSTENPSPAVEQVQPPVASSQPTPPPPPATQPTFPPLPAGEAKLPLSANAQRAGRLALVGVLLNVVSSGITRILDQTFVTASPSMQTVIGLAEIAVLVITRIALIVIIVFAVRAAMRAWPETAKGGGFSGRGRVIATAVLCSLFTVGIIFSIGSIIVLL